MSEVRKGYLIHTTIPPHNHTTVLPHYHSPNPLSSQILQNVIACDVQKKPRILVSPLDWGLGHASRCIPLLREIQKQGMEAILGGSGESLFLLKKEFPQFESLNLPAYQVRYSKRSSQLPIIARQIPRLIRVIKQEHKILNEAILQKNIDAVISDNRYGMYSSHIPSIFICHQLSLPLPDHLSFFSKTLDRIHQKFIGNFDRCWVPDYQGEKSLGGKLSQKQLNMPQEYLGPLSRFDREDLIGQRPFPDLPLNPPEILLVLSGPEPQRSILEEKILQQALGMNYQFWIVQGKAGPITFQKKENCQIISFLDSQRLQWALRRCKGVISRSGYSSLMDYEALGLKKLLLIPTPGQTEQEYLAHKWEENGTAIIQRQGKINLAKGIKEMLELPLEDSLGHKKESQQDLTRIISGFKKGLSPLG